ncbi:ferritin heavy chain-like [Acipenser ruthenus]|uniref:ferritin heavy chain-like n=1 Tax=Acipenser ruthenus TaxID=7906 RepID=UPI0027418AE4|nr:ferritin heavy chain-like [Acipenser ruthenus]
MDKSRVKQNFHQDSEAGLNLLINTKLRASYTFLSMSFFFDRDDVALSNFARFFLERSHAEQEQAERLLGYQLQRGGRVLLQTIQSPSKGEWEGGLDAMVFAVNYQKELNQAVLELHKISGQNNDPHLCDFLEGHFLSRSVEEIKRLGDHVTSLRKLTSCEQQGTMGEYLFDKHTLS